MTEILSVMLWPLVACLILPPLLVYFGLHIIRREVIFVDLALAQVATLGACVAIFTLTRMKEHHQVPQEALIGIVYVVAAAGGILLLNNSPHGNEELKQTLVGELLYLQTPMQVLMPFALFVAIGVVHFLFRKKFLAISFEPARAEKEGLSIRG